MNSCGQAQNNTADKQAIIILKEFYSKYNNEWSLIPPKTSVDIYGKKLDSLNSIYCTPRLREKAKEWLKDGHDLITNDFYGISDPKTLSVTKDISKENTYTVSYIAVEESPYNKNEKITQKVTLHVTVIKEGEGYKIDDVR
jgi:hypothetical protein